MAIDWQAVGVSWVYTLAAILCLGGFIVSCLSLSGTWLVLAATGLVAWIRWPNFPGIGTLVVFLLLCIGVEVLEAIAGAWGVHKRGGSRAAGWAALGGAFAGMLLGGLLIPVPIIGNLIGMAAVSFGAAFWVEYSRIKKAGHATHVATGAIMARLGVIFIKTGVTLSMIGTLAIGLITGSGK
jgi:uncharacterized protein YqgC (DUF456 family)